MKIVSELLVEAASRKQCGGRGAFGECLGTDSEDPMAGTAEWAAPGSGWWNPFPEFPEFRIRVVEEYGRRCSQMKRG